MPNMNVLEQMNSTREKLGMDANYFYPTIITITVALLPVIKSICVHINSRYQDNFLKLYKNEENDFFYAVVMLSELFLWLPIYYILLFIVLHIGYFILLFENEALLYGIVSWLSIIVDLIIVRIASMKITKMRYRIMDRKKFQLLIYAPVILYNFIFYMYFTDCKALLILMYVLFVVVEIMGIVVYRGRYIQYKYANITIYTQNGDRIKCDDVSKIRRKKDIVIIENQREVFHIKYGDISKVEYSGDMVVKLKKFF